MKRLIVVVSVVLIVCIAAVYVLIPGTLQITSILAVRCSAAGAARGLVRPDDWRTRWSGIDGYVCRLRGSAFREMEVSIEKGGDSVASRFTILSVGPMDSIALQWNCQFKTSINPFRRVGQYRLAVGMKQMMDATLGKMRLFLQHNENIYGIPLTNSMCNDSALLVIRMHTPAYPSTREIYGAVGELRAYARSGGARAINYPMLNVTHEDAGYATMVALSVDRRLNGTARIEPKRYVPWKVMIGEVKGGTYAAERGMVQLQEYVSDHQKPAMGLPFQSLVTERDQEPDSSKWVTRVVQAVP
jgi:hypothetical protein